MLIISTVQRMLSSCQVPSNICQRPAHEIAFDMHALELIIGNSSDGTSKLLAIVIVIPFINGVDYQKLREILNMRLKSPPLLFTKQDMNNLLSFAYCTCEHECLRYAVYKATGMTPSQARKKFGWDRGHKRGWDRGHKKWRDALKKQNRLRGHVRN